MKIIKFFVYGVVITFASGCTLINGKPKMSIDRINKQAQETCNSESMVGNERGINISLDASRKKVEEVKLKLDAKYYEKLSQELEGYRVEWEQNNQRYTSACQSYEACKLKAEIWYDKPYSDYCQNEREDFNNEKIWLSTFSEKLIDIRKQISESKK